MVTNSTALRLRVDQYQAGYTIAVDDDFTYVCLNGRKTDKRFSTKTVTDDELQKAADFLIFKDEQWRRIHELDSLQSEWEEHNREKDE